MRSRPYLQGIPVVLMMLAIAPATLASGTTFGATWQAGPQQKTETLVVFFENQPDEVTLVLDGETVEIRLPSGYTCPDPPDGTVLSRKGESTVIQINRPVSALLTAKWWGNALNLVFGETSPVQEDPTYRIGVGDVVTVAVYKNPDLTGDFTVAPDGTITMPLVGAVRADGMTESSLAAHLTEILGKDYLVNPQISVTVKSYQSQYVYVTGSVSRSSRIPIRPGSTLKDVLSEAGVALSGKQELVLTRTTLGGETLRLQGSDLDLPSAPVPRDGDVLNIQEPSYIYVNGEVRRAGRIPLRPGMTLLEAISEAEGFTDWANRKQVKILRKSDGDSSERTVNLKKVEEREIPDPVLEPGDVILVKRRIF